MEGVGRHASINQMLELRGVERKKTMTTVKGSSSKGVDDTNSRDDIPLEDRVGFLGRAMLTYVIPFFFKARKLSSGLTSSHVPPVPDYLRPTQSSARLKEIWAREIASATEANRTPSLRWAVWLLIRSQVGVTMLFVCTATFLNLLIPIMSGGIVRAVSRELPNAIAYALIPAVFVISFFGIYLMQYGFFSQSKAAVMAWGGLTTLVVEHPAKMTSAERGRFTEGEVLNLLSMDCQAVMDVLLFTAFFSVMPLQIVVSVAILLYMLGPSFLVGLGILIINVILSEKLASFIKKLQFRKSMVGDKRNMLLNESFQGIRTVKLYSWEAFIKERVDDRRKQEMAILKAMGQLRGLQTFLSLGLPTMAMVATFVVYRYVYHSLSPTIIFISTGLFEFLNMGMASLPNAVNEVQRMNTSIERIGRFLAASATFTADQGGDIGIVVVDQADFFWEKLAPETLTKKKVKASAWKNMFSKRAKATSVVRVVPPNSSSNEDIHSQNKLTAIPKTPSTPAPEMTLKQISLSAEPGQLIAIVGRVGSGKTSLCAGLLGLLHHKGGRVRVGGKAAYVPQQAFIFNDTVKNNITFGVDLEEEKYRAIIKACALEQDIAMLPAGDNSEVGEKGITISGGQKQRLAIARAAYASPDVVVLDDPLSAMDAHVGRQVFTNCLTGGPLKNSTRIMATNQLQFCEGCDKVYVLVDGRVVESGTHSELMIRRGEYYTLALHVVGTQSHDSHSDDETNKAEKTKSLLEKAVEKVREVVVPSATATATEATATPASSAAAAASSAPDAAKKPAGHGGAGGPGASGGLMTKEKKSSGRIGARTFILLAGASQSQILGILVFFLFVACPVLQYAVNIFLAKWTDSFHTQKSSTVNFALYLTFAGIFALSAGLRSVIFTMFFTKASRRLHNRMLNAVLGSPMSFFDTTPIGRVLNRFSGDVMQLDLLFPRLFEIWAYLTGMTVVVIFVAGIIVPYILPASVFLVICVAALYIFFGAVVLELRRILMMSYSPLTAFFSGYIYGLDSIRAFGRVEVFFEKFRKLQIAPVATMYHLSAIQAFVNALIMATIVAAFMTILSLVLILLRDSPFVTPGYAGLLFSYGSVLSLRAPTVFFMTTMLEQLLSSVQRIIEYIGLPQEGQKKATIAVDESWPARGGVEVKGVVMAYRPDLPDVLRGITFSIRPGEKVGVVGRTGAGKSSLVLALFRMVELKAGSIEIDGQDISSVPLHDLRHRLGMIPQDPFLFSGTIRSNLDVTSQYSDEEIWEALRMVNLSNSVRELDGQLEHAVKEKGSNFSAGTVQLMCMARVLLKKPKIIFMDEATASVDLETDAFVQKTVRQAFGHCTIITIAHRLNTVIDYDKVLVLDAGKVAEYGSPYELLNNDNGILTNLVNQTGESSSAELKIRARAAEEARGVVL
eukprot:c10543_g1_i1.p1 GENE.c10543_g1_i1~~c10543_g1_i1.p1  ORF type:complete len:1410 (-),score=317.84 c10543_g1_i1:416-4645(-)